MDEKATEPIKAKRRISFGGLSQRARSKTSGVLAAYRHVANTDESVKKRPDTAQEKMLRALKEKSLAKFIDNMNDLEVEHSKKVIETTREHNTRLRERQGEPMPVLPNDANQIIELINRLLNEHDA